MKKILKVCAVALSMAVLFVSCANDSTEPAPDYYKTTNPNPNYKPAEGTSTVKDGTTAGKLMGAIADFGTDPIAIKDEFWGKGENSTQLQKDVMPQVFNEKGDVNVPLEINLTGKKYETDNTLINIKKGEVNYKVTEKKDDKSDKEKVTSTIYNADANINGIIEADCSKFKDWTNKTAEDGSAIPNLVYDEEAPDDPYLKDARIFASAKGNGQVVLKPVPYDQNEIGPMSCRAAETDDGKLNKVTIANQYIDSVKGKLDVLLNGSAIFETEEYYGLLNAKAKVIAPDLSKSYAKIEAMLLDTESPVKKQFDEVSNQPTFDAISDLLTNSKYNELLAFLDTIGIKINAQINITDLNGNNPQNILYVDSFVEIGNFAKSLSKK